MGSLAVAFESGFSQASWISFSGQLHQRHNAC